MRFAKLHGLGNGFVLVDARGGREAFPLDAQLARRLCDRHRGIGADGLMILREANPGEAALAARLIIYNPDGSRPEMCGNGARCAALWLATEGCTKPARAEVLLLTDSGPRLCTVDAMESATLGMVEIDMGPPRLEPRRALALSFGPHLSTPVSMGNPHRVLFFDEAPDVGDTRALAALCAREGPALSLSEDANIEFVKSLGPQQFVASVWERGAGQTDACGTGACAIAAAAIERGLARKGEAISVRLPGGELALRLEGGSMKMRGAAELVFTGALANPAST